jgi:asparagine synthase (glutamine-hydrolysing)
MPGIVGMISQRPAVECESRVKAMITSMEHERFYISGMYIEPEMGMCGGWVAHENSFAAGQIFFNEPKDLALIFSGECFLDPQTRTDLGQKGHRFEENNGAWLVHLYEETGASFFERLNGLFSGLLIDKRQGTTFLFNDRYGVERIYWHEVDGEFYFATEAKALLRILPELREFDEEGVAQFMTYGCTFDGRTLFRGMHVLPGGSLWSFENGNCNKKQYFSPETWETQPPSSECFESDFEETFKEVLPRYLESHSRIGISLTAGLDSRMIMACLPELEQKPLSYTFSGEKGLTLDDRLAARVAKTCGVEHQLLRIGADFFSNFATYADRTIHISDGCFGIIGAHEIYLTHQARELAPVRLTGNFGSEILRGTSTFRKERLSPQLLNPEISSTIDSLATLPLPTSEHPVTFAAFREIPWSLFGSMVAGRSQTIFRTPYLDNQVVALAYRIPEQLRQSSEPALSLIRRSKPALARIPTDMGLSGITSGAISALRHSLARTTFKLDYFNNEGLPHWLSPFDPVLRSLQGIGIVGLHKYLHYRSWFCRELSSYLLDAFADVLTRRSPFWNTRFLEHIVREQTRGRKNYVREINAVLTLDAVERLLLRGVSSQAGAAGHLVPRILSAATE